MFLVQLPDPSAEGTGNEGEHAREPVWLPRLSVCFDAEDPGHYARRYAAAHAARADALRMMRYELALDCMPAEGMPQLTTEQVGRGRGGKRARARVRAQQRACVHAALCWDERALRVAVAAQPCRRAGVGRSPRRRPRCRPVVRAPVLFHGPVTAGCRGAPPRRRRSTASWGWR